MEELRSAARSAALEGGRVILEGAPERAEAKGVGDYVTEVDRAAERAIASLLERRTGIGVRGEEHGGEAAARHWLVDPVDGTTNLMHGFPVVGVSVALIEEGRPVVGVVHAPRLGATWTALRGGGAERNGRRLAVSQRPPSRAVVATGFPFRRKDRLPEYLALFGPALERFEDLRRPGAASLDLAWVADGTFDGFFELGLSSWDVAAGALLIEEAGGRVSDWSGAGGYLGGDILAGSPAVHGTLVELAAQARS